MRLLLSVLATVASVAFASGAHSSAYYAGADSRNDCYSFEQGDTSASCIYSSSPDAACAYYGSILEAEGTQPYPSYYPYYAEETLNNKCYRANGTQVTTQWFENANYSCVDDDLDGQCDTAEEICADGFPSSADPRGCDRPDLAQCQDGSYVEAGSGICPTYTPPCTDRQTCYEYSKTQIACSSSQIYSTFIYYDPSNFNISCSDVDPNSPDHPDNGGNLDGNPYNDPSSEPEPDGYWYVAQQTGQQVQSEQQAQLADIERAIREGNTSSESGAQQISDTINATGNQAHVDSQNLENAVNDSADRTVSELGIVIDRLDTMNSNAAANSGSEQGLLSTISQTLSNIYDSITSLADTFSADTAQQDFTAVGDAINQALDEDSEEQKNMVLDEIQGLIDNPELGEDQVSDATEYIEQLFPGVGNCQPLVFGDPSKPYSFTISCDSVVKTRELLSVAIYFVTAIALIQILLTGVTPRVKGGNA